MKDYLRMAWKKVIAKIGAVESLIKPIAKQIKIAIDTEDLVMLRAIATEGLEAVEAEAALYRAILVDTEDGNLDLAEGAELLLLIQDLVDEREDQFTGKDEDDIVIPPVTAKKAAKKK